MEIPRHCPTGTESEHTNDTDHGVKAITVIVVLTSKMLFVILSNLKRGGHVWEVCGLWRVRLLSYILWKCHVSNEVFLAILLKTKIVQIDFSFGLATMLSGNSSGLNKRTRWEKWNREYGWGRQWQWPPTNQQKLFTCGWQLPDIGSIEWNIYLDGTYIWMVNTMESDRIRFKSRSRNGG